jgi:hypothetical protein
MKHLGAVNWRLSAPYIGRAASDRHSEMRHLSAQKKSPARTLYEVMCVQYPGRLVMLCDKAQILRRSDRAD